MFLNLIQEPGVVISFIHSYISFVLVYFAAFLQDKAL